MPDRAPRSATVSARTDRPGAVLLCPGEGEARWWSHGLVWHDGSTLFATLGDEVRLLSLPGPARLHVTPDRVVAWVEGGHRVQLDRTGRERWDGPATGWGADATLEALLEGAPLGARSARWRWPARSGQVLLWVGGAWVYRRVGGRVDLVGDASAPLWPGPDGAALTESWVAPPRGRSRPLEVPLVPVAWSADGTRVAGVDDRGLVLVDTTTGRALDRQLDRIPLDAHGTTLAPGAGLVERGGAVLAAGLRAGAWARDGALLAGPGGQVWDLAAERPLSNAPVLRGAATARTPDGWISFREDGCGVWLDPRGGLMGLIRLPLGPGDEVEAAWWHDDGVRVQAGSGRQLHVDPSGAALPAARARRVPTPRLPAGVLPGRHDTRLDGVRWPVRAVGAARLGDRTWVWTASGALLRLQG